jgi:hypothetical protein
MLEGCVGERGQIERKKRVGYCSAFQVVWVVNRGL